MNISREDLERAVGETIPTETPIVEAETLPPPEEQAAQGIFFKLAAVINGKWKVFLGSKWGTIVSVYLLAITLGFDLPKPVPLAVMTFERFQDVSASVYAYLETPTQKAEGYLVSLPLNFTRPSSFHNTFAEIPVGSGVYPVSAAYLG